MRMHTGVYWSAGSEHAANQDSLSLQHIKLRKGECLLAVVCDGIGSLACSQEAGALAVRQMTDWFYQEGKELICENSAKEMILLALQRQFYQIQENLTTFQQTQNIRTGTTLTGLLLVRNRYYLMHIGDSRIYHIENRKNPFAKLHVKVRCMTTDDTNSQGCLLKCLGMAGEDRVFLNTGKIKKRTGFLLCTDGFCYGNEKLRIGQALGPVLGWRRTGQSGKGQNTCLKNGVIDRRLELLGEQAVKCGSRDNMAAIGIVLE